MPHRVGIRVVLDEADSRVHITIGAEIILFTINSSISSSIQTRTIAVTGSSSVNYPSALGGAVLIEGILDAADGLFTNIQLILASACVAILAIASVLPTGLQGAVDGVVQVAVHFEDAGAGGIDLAATFIGADELTVNDLIVMGDLDLGDDGAPIDDGVAGLAIGTVLIASLSSGSFLIQNGQLLVVDMIGRRNGCQLGSNIDAAAEQLIIYSTADNITYDVNNRTVIVGDIPTCFICISCRIVIFLVNKIVKVIGPYANRNAYERVIKSLASYSFSLHGDVEKFRNFIVLKGSLKAVGNDSTLGFPGVSVVQLQLGLQLDNHAQVSHIDIHIVDRLCLGSFAGFVVTGQFHNSIAGNGKAADELCGVAQFIADLEGYSMGTGAESNVTLGG